MTATRGVALDELLLCVESPGHEGFMQAGTLKAWFGGAEANISAARATDGVNSAFVAAVTPNPLGNAAIGELRCFRIDTSHVVRDERRIGTYYLEVGAGQHPGRVIYDRENSVLTQVELAAFDWSKCLTGASWLHVRDIGPALRGRTPAAVGS